MDTVQVRKTDTHHCPPQHFIKCITVFVMSALIYVNVNVSEKSGKCRDTRKTNEKTTKDLMEREMQKKKTKNMFFI